MNLPFDLEDIFGVAVADLIKRSGYLLSMLALGWAIVPVAGLAAEIIHEWIQRSLLGSSHWAHSLPEFGWSLVADLLFGPFTPLTSSWGVIYIPVLLSLVFYVFKADAPAAGVWVAGVGFVGFFVLLDHEFYGGMAGWICFGIWLCELAGLVFFLKLWTNRSRVGAEIHLMGVSAENELKRRQHEIAGGPGQAVTEERHE